MMGAVCSALLEVGEVVIKSGRVKDFWVYSLPLSPPYCYGRAESYINFKLSSPGLIIIIG